MTELDIRFWKIKGFKQRVEAKVWKKILLNSEDTIIKNGKLRKIKAKNLGLGIYELSLIRED